MDVVRDDLPFCARSPDPMARARPLGPTPHPPRPLHKKSSLSRVGVNSGKVGYTTAGSAGSLLPNACERGEHTRCKGNVLLDLGELHGKCLVVEWQSPDGAGGARLQVSLQTVPSSTGGRPSPDLRSKQTPGPETVHTRQARARPPTCNDWHVFDPNAVMREMRFLMGSCTSCAMCGKPEFATRTWSWSKTLSNLVVVASASFFTC